MDEKMFGSLPNEFEAFSPGSIYPREGYRIFVAGEPVTRLVAYNQGAVIRVEPKRRYPPAKR